MGIRIQKAFERSISPQSFIVSDGSNEATYKTITEVRELLGIDEGIVSFYTGTSTQSSNGLNLTFDIVHGATYNGVPQVPNFVSVTVGSNDAEGYKKVTVNSNTITVHYDVAPPIGTNNLIFNWLVVAPGEETPGNGGGGTGISTDLNYLTNPFNGVVTSSSGNDATIPGATTSIAGLLTASDKAKLDSINVGAEVNVQADWNQSNSSADDFIKNKPTIPSTAGFATISYVDNQDATKQNTLIICSDITP